MALSTHNSPGPWLCMGDVRIRIAFLSTGWSLSGCRPRPAGPARRPVAAGGRGANDRGDVEDSNGGEPVNGASSRRSATTAGRPGSCWRSAGTSRGTARGVGGGSRAAVGAAPVRADRRRPRVRRRRRGLGGPSRRHRRAGAPPRERAPGADLCHLTSLGIEPPDIQPWGTRGRPGGSGNEPLAVDDRDPGRIVRYCRGKPDWADKPLAGLLSSANAPIVVPSG
jgi:hypothetical protein